MKGIIYALLATVSFSAGPTFTQIGYKGGIQTNTLLFSRHLVSLICLIPVVFKKDTFTSIGRKQIPGIAVLCILSIVSNLSFNYAYHYLPNMIATAIGLSYVIFVVIIEMLLGREKYTPRRGFIIALTFSGIAVIAIPGFGGAFSMKAFMIGVMAAVLDATTITLINSKHLKQVSTNVILLTGIVPVMVYSFIRCAVSGEPLLPSGSLQWISIICLGTIGLIVARGLSYKAIRIIGATRTSMIDSLQPFTSAVLGYIFLSQGFSIFTALGSVLLMISVILLLKDKSA